MHEMRHDIGEKDSSKKTSDVVIPVHFGFLLVWAPQASLQCRFPCPANQIYVAPRQVSHFLIIDLGLLQSASLLYFRTSLIRQLAVELLLFTNSRWF